jgi:hypothetical protein
MDKYTRVKVNCQYYPAKIILPLPFPQMDESKEGLLPGQ